MARFYRCEQCGTLQGTVSAFAEEPQECDECHHEEFEIVGPKAQGTVDRIRGNLSAGRAVRLMLGLGMFNLVVTVVFALVSPGQSLQAFTTANAVLLIGLAYGLSRHSKAAWGISLATLAVGTLAGFAVVAEKMVEGLVGVSIPVVGAQVAGLDGLLTVLLVVYSALYAWGTLNLYGGRAEFFLEAER